MNGVSVVSEVEEIANAVRALASVCDGAVEEDGRGFNGTDASFGKRLAELPLNRWSAGNVSAAHRMLAKYRGQLAGFGIDYAAIPAPPAIEEETRRTFRLADVCGLDAEDGIFLMRFPYDATMVNACRRIPGRQWHAKEKSNVFPVSSAPQVAAFIAEYGHDWELTPAARDILDGTKVPESGETPPIGSVDLEGDDFAVFVYEYDPKMVDELRGIRGRRWVPERRVNMIASFGAKGLAEFLERHEGFEVSDDAVRRMAEQEALAETERKSADTMAALSRGTDADVEISGLGGELRPFQRAGVAYVQMADGRAIIGDDMGTGKTVQALALMAVRRAFPAVVVCPASVKLSWRDHVQGPPRWTPAHPIPEHGWLPDRKVVVLSGKTPNSDLLVGAEVIVLNWDILDAWCEELCGLEPEAVVFDESHYAKSRAAARTKAALKLAKSTRRKIGFEQGPLKLCLSGTSVVNRPKELISQLELIDRLKDFGGSKTFRSRYCDTYWDGYRWDDRGASNPEELNRLLREKCFIRRTKAEVMPELPAKQPARVPVVLSNPKDYDRAEQETIKFLIESVERDRTFTSSLAGLTAVERADAIKSRQNDKAEAARRAEKIVRMNLLRKVCAAGKIKAAVDWVREFMESSSKLIVFAHHIEVQKALLEAFPDSARVLGEDSAAKRTLAIERFQTDEDCRLIVCSLKAAREGITLTAASDVATIELDWTPATHDQAEDRAHRMGQRDSVTCWYLLAEGTIDDDMHELIEGKREVTSAVMDGTAKRREMETSIMGALEDRLIAKGLKR